MAIYKIPLGKAEIKWETKLLILSGSSSEVSPSFHSKQFFLTTPLSLATKYCFCIGLFEYSKVHICNCTPNVCLVFTWGWLQVFWRH